MLSFSLLEGEGAEFADALLGDVVISWQTTKRQAREQKVQVADELTRLLVHGVLHLHGYDHENVPKKEADRMRRKEQELFAELSRAFPI